MADPVVLTSLKSPMWYCVLSVLMSLYQAVRGCAFQIQFANSQKDSQKDDKTKFAPGVKSDFQIWFLRGLADGLYYFITTLAGFVSLLLAYRILSQTQSLEMLSGGALAVFIFLALFGLLGITGKLPDLLQQGKWPFWPH